jgi:hypothetical protein
MLLSRVGFAEQTGYAYIAVALSNGKPNAG